MIPGVERRALVPHSDARGTLRETWRRSSQPFDVRQVLVTSSNPGALRGMHFHLRQADLCFVPAGRIFLALLDLRSDDLIKEELWVDGADSILIPPGVAHGYATPDGATVCYLLTEEVDGSDEFGFRFDDPRAAIRWPVSAPTLSKRDQEAGSLAEAIAAVRARLAQRVGSKA
ncbi:MAG TPA: dTDP-4-dehydrorhamnose 3,5-epimerase family protein [Candidatus Limnocylindria bacterium]|nr:dTDP-4-dehydrorhamnose 3,5-epimerase family protein [Candidatus Limnocylindria bacterium]